MPVSLQVAKAYGRNETTTSFQIVGLKLWRLKPLTFEIWGKRVPQKCHAKRWFQGKTSIIAKTQEKADFPRKVEGILDPQRAKSGGRRWIRTIEGVSQQIYSLPPLATWVFYRANQVPVLQGRE
jgi:hypothetical protein